MRIAGFQKLTLLDYPEHLACIIFTSGCNFKCPFCQNSPLISSNFDQKMINEDEILSYLKKRKHILDGIVISGGEPTVQKDLKQFIIKVKEIGVKVKLDTNGYNPIILRDLIDNNLLDYVAMDVKNSIPKYNKVIGLKSINTDNILESIDILNDSDVPHEFRTTIMKEYHTKEDIFDIIDMIGKNSKYYLQNFRDSENVLYKNLHGFSEEELNELKNIIIKKNNSLKIR